ncbi:DUF4181 domain-containing protein [Alkalihalobacillus sp. 1P02AB]|uniref:DUF4181 domain-containing protein n=1 Tax=Alkalihalobacillus sp. 1P02AB TaxID=3132260 RepID=UPI0039A57CB5
MFLLKLVLVALVMLFLTSAVKVILRKIFNIEKEKKKFFSYNHLNELHKKIDWGIRIFFSVALAFFIYFEYSINIGLVTLIFYIGLECSTRAFFEWKYSKNPKQSIITISEVLLLIIVLIIVIQLDILSTVS